MKKGKAASLKGFYDAIVVGGGPAGLTAAYYMAKDGFTVLVLERLSSIGMLSHPCGCMVSPVKNYITFEKRVEGVYFKEVDFTFPNETIIAYPKTLRFIGPSGTGFGMLITKNREKSLIFQIDKEKVLKILADKAKNAGAEIRCGTHVTGLTKENGFVRGVVIGSDCVKARVVISAEGLPRKLANEAGLFGEKPSSFFVILSAYLENLQLNENDLGQISTLGSVYSSLPKAMGTLHSLGHNKALLVFAVLLSENKWPYNRRLTDYLYDYVSRVSWINELCNKGVITGRKGCWMPLQKPKALVTNGFVGIGDTVAPLGHLSNAIAMLMGKEAAVTASNALHKGDVSSEALSDYNKCLKSKLFSGVEFEAKLITSLLNLTDKQIDTICNCFANINLEPFLIGTPTQRTIATLKLLTKHKVIRNWKLCKKLF